MPSDQRSIGGLNIYRTRRHPVLLDASGARPAVRRPRRRRRHHVTNYAKAQNEATHVRRAMESRAVIEQAKGMIMARNMWTADEAFNMLTRISSSRTSSSEISPNSSSTPVTSNDRPSR
jgi:hypothetical protein